MINHFNFPENFKSYEWNDKHYLYGYPGDKYPEFKWIKSLEDRFDFTRRERKHNEVAIYLIKEMIQWGGSQNGTLQKFEDGQGLINFKTTLDNIINNISDPVNAITHALSIPGMGLTYASKLLRFIDPENYGALDSRIRSLIKDSDYELFKNFPNIYDSSQSSMIRGYVEYLKILRLLQNKLEADNINRPECGFVKSLRFKTQWRISDIEMALFSIR